MAKLTSKKVHRKFPSIGKGKSSSHTVNMFENRHK